MNQKIDILCRNQNGSNALHIAVKKENVEVIKVLLKMNYPLDFTKSNGVTAAGIAAFKGNLKILQILDNGGADLNFVGKNGVCALTLSIKSN